MWKKNNIQLLLITVVGIFFLSFIRSKSEQSLFIVPAKWPEPVYDFSKNKLSKEGFELGRILFYDPGISRDKTISCASCHLQYTGFTHVDHNVSHGIEDRKGTRNSPVLINLAWNSTFHWDGGVNHLEMQPLNPIQHQAEMDNKLQNVLDYLNGSLKYKALFFDAFGDSTVNTKNFLKAMTQFTVSLVSSNSKYDKVMRGEEKFTTQEKNGHKLFKQHCNSCHKAPLFNINSFKSNGLPIDSVYKDVGRFAITHVPSDSMLFRVPTLRNIQHTMPYMHDGRFKKLKDVLEYYNDGIDHQTRYLSTELRRDLNLSDNDKKDLLAFLYSLTDYTFLYDKRYSYSKIP